MFSLDKFYNVLHNNLISHCENGYSVFFHPFGTYDVMKRMNKKFDDIKYDLIYWTKNDKFVHCYYFDQEPFYDYTAQIVDKSFFSAGRKNPIHINILANSERSEILTNYINSQHMHDWHYFFHGFAALDWYRDFQYVTTDTFNRFDKVFICYNHLTSNLRSYRLHLCANLIEQDLVKHGRVSLFHGGWQKTVEDFKNPLDNRARVKIYHALKNVSEPLTIDTTTPNGALSANVILDQLTSALWHIVTETVYFDAKLHLTEKIFKPIVAKRPFILVAAPGNLAYLKSYGFRTFDRWIDESYDLETDHYIRIEKITAEIARLCAMDRSALEQMHQEMQEVLNYNFTHFYTTFKDLIVDELVDNFGAIIDSVDVQLPPGHLAEVKTRLKQ